MSALDHNAISILLRECILGYTKIQKLISGTDDKTIMILEQQAY